MAKDLTEKNEKIKINLPSLTALSKSSQSRTKNYSKRPQNKS